MSAFTPLVLNSPTQFSFNVSQYTSDVIVAPCCMNSTINTLLPQKAVAISFLADNVCVIFLGLSGECV
jgi:hypothetical protein